MRQDGKFASRAAQQSLTSRVRAGVARAAPALADGASLHVDRLRVRVPRGASATEISRSITKAAGRAKERKT